MQSAPFAVIGLLIVLVLSLASYQRNSTWSDPLTLLQDTVRKSPDKRRVHYNLATTLSAAGRIDEAIDHFREAIRLGPTPEEYNNLGSAYQEKGMILQAIEQHLHALALDQSSAEAYFNLGRAYLVSNGRTADAIAMFTTALSLRKVYPDASVNLGAAYIRAKQYEEAIRVLGPVIAAAPGRADARFNRGVAFVCAGNAAAANEELTALSGLDQRLAGQLDAFMRQTGGACGKSRK